MPGLLTAAELSRIRLDRLVESADRYRGGSGRRHPDALIGLVFYDESLRTRVGFEAAIARIGARSTTVFGGKRSAAMWGDETLEDVVRSVAAWWDVLCLRHPEVDAPHRASGAIPTPVLNCGNGNDEHPTQALVDMFAIQQLLGRIDGLRVALVGDLDGMRTAHSLALVLALCESIHVRTISPPGLTLPPRYSDALRAAGHAVEESTSLHLDDVDIVYVAGLPADTSAGVLSVAEQGRYRITTEVVGRLAPGARILCPLPRVDEISPEVDALPAAGYFAQSGGALWMRMAVLDDVLAGASER